VTRALAAVIVTIAALSGRAVAQDNQAAATSTASWTIEEILPLTCGQAWQKSGKSVPDFVKILVAEGELSLQNRGLTLPESAHAKSQEIGKAIRQSCESDPDELLYAVVDRTLRPYGVAAPQ
jgi:hypothetical protein